MALIDDVKTLIDGALPGAKVDVLDEGGGDHLRVDVTASQFEGLSRIEQHRLVKNAVRERSDTGELHSLSIKQNITLDLLAMGQTLPGTMDRNIEIKVTPAKPKDETTKPAAKAEAKN